MLLKVSQINKKGEGQFAIRQISFTQKRQQKIAIVGETGSGKSTLLKIIAGLEQQDAGEVFLEGERVKGPADKLVPGHASIAYLSQYFELQKFLTVAQILSYANHLSDKEANKIYKVCEIDHLLTRKTDQLSGGEKQRIAMARLLISSPRLLLLDEPFSHLDMVHKNTLRNVIDNISDQLKITCMLVSHDPNDTLSWADKILVLKEGKVLQEGTPETIYKKPVSEYVAGLFGKYNIISPDLMNLLSLTAAKRKLIFRPEDFKLLPKGKKELKGKITSMQFFGSYKEVVFEIVKTQVVVRTRNMKIKKGDSLYLSLRD